MHFAYTKNIALCGTYRVTAFFGRMEFRKGEDEFMRSIEVSRPRSTSNSDCASQPPYDFIESDNTSYHIRGDMSMNIFRVNNTDSRLIKLCNIDTIAQLYR